MFIHLRQYFSILEWIKIIFNSILFRFTSRIVHNELLFKFEIFKEIKRKDWKLEELGDEYRIAAILNNRHLVFYIRKDSSDLFVFNQVIIEEEYSKLLLMQNHEKGNLVIIDAGANIGCTSLWFASYFPNAVIYAIEADASNFRYLEKNIRENKFSQSVLIYFNALWKDNSVLNISDSFRGGKEDSKRIILGNVENENSVKGITISDLKELVWGRRIDIFKMDIEGAESELFPDLEHAKVFLDSIDILAVELHPECINVDVVLQYFKECGFSSDKVGETHFCLHNS